MLNYMILSHIVLILLVKPYELLIRSRAFKSIQKYHMMRIT